MLLGQPGPVVEHADQRPHREHHQMLAGGEHGGAELPERHPRGRFHDQVGAEHQLVERIRGIADGGGRVAHGDPGQRHPRDVAARRPGDGLADDAHADDADLEHADLLTSLGMLGVYPRWDDYDSERKEREIQ
jgi:hypothetical protein